MPGNITNMNYLAVEPVGFKITSNSFKETFSSTLQPSTPPAPVPQLQHIFFDPVCLQKLEDCHYVKSSVTVSFGKEEVPLVQDQYKGDNVNGRRVSALLLQNIFSGCFISVYKMSPICG